MIDAHQKCVKRNKRETIQNTEKKKNIQSVNQYEPVLHSRGDWHQKRLYTACVSLNLAFILTKVRRQPLYSKVLVVCAKRSLARMRLKLKKKIHNFQINKKQFDYWLNNWKGIKKIFFKWIYFENSIDFESNSFYETI